MPRRFSREWSPRLFAAGSQGIQFGRFARLAFVILARRAAFLPVARLHFGRLGLLLRGAGERGRFGLRQAILWLRLPIATIHRGLRIGWAGLLAASRGAEKRKGGKSWGLRQASSAVERI